MTWERLPFDKPGPDGYYADNASVRYVHLVGTNHKAEWTFHRIRNLGRIRAPVGKVHPDYYNAALRVVKWILANPGFVAVVLSGHSYGGAVAELVKAIMIGRGFNCELRTYGGIKPGAICVEGYAENTTHYRHRGDLATLWPLWPWYRRRGKVARVGRRIWWPPTEPHQIQSYREATGHDIP